MSYSIRVLDAGASSEVGELKNIVNAEVYEVINDQYTADVEIAENKFPAFLQYPNLLEVEGDYFLIAGIDKQRNNSKSIRLNLEHISYLLNDPFGAPFTAEGEEEIYEGSPGDILSRVWGLGAFQIVDLVGGFYEYRPSAKGGRSRINEFARQNGLEVEYKQFSVIIHNRRGGDNGLVLEVGKNIESIQQKIDLNDNFSLEYAHEVQIIDFSKMTGAQKKDIASAELGDTVTMIDTDLDIYAVERIVAKRYNPLFKETPQLDVGQIIRDFVTYEDEKEEEEKEDEDKGLLAQFKVGKIDCLALDDNIDAKNAVLDYLKDTSLQGVIPSTDVELTESQTGVIASLKPDFSSYKLTAIITTETESGLDTDFYELPNTAISSLVLPQQNVSVSVTLVVTKEAFADLVDGKVPIVEDGENKTFLEAYGVRFLINDGADGFLENFKVGNVDVLSFDDIECTSEVVAYIKGQNPNPHATSEQETTKLKGVYASLKEQYKNHYLTFIHTKVVEDQTTTEVRKMPFANGRIMEIPTAKDDSVIMVVTKEPFESLTAANVDASFIKAFGVRFKAAREVFLEEFKIGETDYLLDEGIEVDKDELAAINTEIEYAEADEFTGLFLKLKKAYSDYEISIKEYTASGSATNLYTDAYKTKKLPGNLVALSVTVSKSTEKQIFAVKFKKTDSPEDNDYLAEFRIGTEDVLPIASEETQAVIDFIHGNTTEVVPAANLEAGENEYTGLFAQLAQGYVDYHLTIIISIKTTEGMKGNEIMPWDEVKSGVDQMPILPPGFSYYAFTFVVSDIPFSDLSSANTDSAFVKAFGVTAGTVDETESKPTNGVKYAYIGSDHERISGLSCVSLRFITNVADFRADFVEGKYFEADSETTDLYPVAYGLYYGAGDLVQVIDGVVTSILSSNNSS